VLGAAAAGCSPPALNASPTPLPATPLRSGTEPAPHPVGSSTPVPGPVALTKVIPAPTDIIVNTAEELYEQSFSSIATVKADEWQLVLDGLVSNRRIFTLDDIRALPVVEIMRTLECIGNPVGGPLIGNAVWKGTYLKPLLDEAGIQPTARRVKFEAADGYDTAVELKFIDDPRSFLAYEMNGEPLTPEHGFPLRVFVPGSYGQKMPKWVTRMELVDNDHEGYWEREGWSDVAQVKTNAIIEWPFSNARLANELTPLWGVAYAGKRDIVKVEIKVDDEDWRGAEVLHGPTNEAWTQWHIDWQPTRGGSHKISVRATDETGFTQSKSSTSVLNGYPDGTDAIHAVYVTVVDA
jgi:DMSO/TMAO reductase YedYZ molybdopterin-dependent catalytic subunit